MQKATGGASAFFGATPPSYLTIAEKLRCESPEAIKPPKKKGRLRPGYGAEPRNTPFSVRGRRMLVRTGALIGKNRYQHPVLFLTGTLPGSTSDAMKALSDYSALVVHELLTHIPRLFQGKPSDCRWLWVWEHQKRGALHWHCVLECPSTAAADLVMKGFKPLWIRVLELVGRKAAVDIAARDGGGTHAGNYDVWQVDVQVAEKRPDRYLSKYVSKGSTVTNAFYPTRWYGINRRLHNELRDSIEHFETHKTNAERHVVTEFDLSIIDKIMSDSYLSRHFPDKVGSGYNFVCYLEDEKMDEARRIFGNIKRTFELKGESIVGEKGVKYYVAISFCAQKAWVLDRLCADLGDYYRKLLYRWLDGDEEVPDTELFWIEYYARRLLYVLGMSYEGQPPERSGAGLPAPSIVTLENALPPCRDWVQSSLIP